MSLNAQRNLRRNQVPLSQAMQRLSSGLRINSAKDDAAGLAIATRMDSQTRGLTVAVRNANDGLSVSQTAEGALDEVINNLQRVRELAVQAKSGQYSASDVGYMQQEADALINEVQRTADQTKFNNIKLFDGNYNKTMHVSYAASDAGISIGIGNMSTSQLGGGGSKLNDLLSGGAQQLSSTTSTAISVLDGALSTILTEKAKLGAKANQFEAAVRNIENVIETTQASRSRIMDADFANETANMTKSLILQQAGVSVLSQANSIPQSVLALLK
jgi:flagellin